MSLWSRRFPLLTLAAVAIAAGYYLLSKTAPPPVEADRPQWLYATSAEDIERITVAVAGRRETFVKTSDGWVFETPAGLPVDMTRWSAIPLLLSGTTVARRLEAAENASTYGFDHPTAIVDLYLRGERRIQVQIGDKTPDGANYYAALAGLPDISLVNAAWGQVVIRLVTDPPAAR